VNRRGIIALFVAAVLSLVAIVVVAAERERRSGASAPSTGPARFEGAVSPRGVRVPDFELRDQDGEPITMREFRGRPVIVTFLYTHCEEGCPPQAQQVKGALNELGHEVPAIAISVDPANDTPESARAFLSEQRMTGRLDFVLGSQQELAPLWREYAVRPQRRRAEHQSLTVLVDKRGFRRVAFPLNQTTPERLAHDVRLLEAE
jgi:protein SCO1/2